MVVLDKKGNIFKGLAVGVGSTLSLKCGFANSN